ncbi:MAG: tetratricopeptide repeat protein [Candidatus Omnitrophica bacterium]|nr:tetratricopeptide repeat protein [Candidatus Omnitrophota bacterium]
MENAKLQKNKSRYIDLIICLGIFFFAFFLRLIYLYEYRNNPFFDSPVIDALTNYLFAMRAAEGDWLVKGVVVGRGPVYVYFLAGLFKIFGAGFTTVRVWQMALGAVNCILVYFLGKKIFSRSVGVISAFICSMYGVLIYFDAEFLYVGLAIFINILLILSLLNSIDRPKVWKWIGCGILLGASLQTNATIILFFPLLFIWLFLSADKKKQDEQINNKKIRFRKAMGPFLLIATGVSLVMLPFTLRNYFMGGDLVMIGSAVGINLHIGNNLNADGKSVNVPTRDFSYSNQWDDNTLIAAKKGAEREMGREILPSEASNYWIRKSLGFMLTNPVTALSLFIRKFYYFFNAYEIAENQSIYFYRLWSPLLKILVFHNRVLAFPFGIICPLALWGIAVSAKKNKAVMLLLIYLAAFLMLMMIFFVCSRYRTIAVPVFVIFAAVALDWYAKQIRERKFKVLFLSLIPLFFLYLFSNSIVFDIRQEDQSRWFLNLGTAYRNKGENEKAIKSFKAAEKVNPRNPDAVYNLGVIYLEKEEYQDAIEEFRKSIKIDEYDSAAYSNVGIVLMKQKKIDEAIASFQSALTLDPADVTAMANLGAALITKGDYPAALLVLKQGLERDENFPPLHLHLGILFEETGKYAEAEQAYISAIKKDPEYIQAYWGLAKLYDIIGLPDKAKWARTKAMYMVSDKLK